jgi:hypothetical protein
MKTNHVFHAHSMGETKTSPAPTPFFISDNPSEYIVKYSRSMGAGNIWISVHSAMKLASTWDLMAFRGAYVMSSPISLSAYFVIFRIASSSR